MTTLLVLVTLLVVILFIIGVPVLLVIGLWCIGASCLINLPLANLGIAMNEGLNSFGLLAMPLFILTGDLINAAGIARKLTEFSQACLCWLRGGLAVSSLSACGVFAAISGSNAATTATIGAIMHPKMVEENYDSNFSAATVAAGGTVGIIIPPSIVFIMYGFLLNISVTDLFLGGVIPGSLMVLSMIIVAWFVTRRHKMGLIQKFSPKRVAVSACRAYLGFFAIFLIMFGISTGAFSPTESAAVCVGYCVICGIFITRELKLRELPDLLFSSGKTVGMVAPLVAVSLVMQQCLSTLGVGPALSRMLGGFSYEMLIALCMLVVLIAGMFLEATPAVTILAPILGPLAQSAGANPVHFGVIMLVGLAIGFITPPFGLNIFVASSVSGIPYARLIKHLMPYLYGLLITWVLLAIVPWFSICLL